MKRSVIAILNTILILFLFSCHFSDPNPKKNGLITYYSDKNGPYNIFVMNSEGTRQHQLTGDKTENICGVWSPDRKYMIFSSKRAGKSEIYIMDAYGNNQKRLTFNETPDYQQRWSPDSKKVVYVSNEDGNQEIYTMDINGDNKTNLTSSDINEMFPCWSSNGKTILYSREENEGWKIYKMDSNGENHEKVSDYHGHDWELYPQYSPNGKKIAYFTHEPKTNIRNILVMNKNGKNRKQLTYSDFVDEDPYWSPDGKYIVFQSNRTGNYQIYTMRANGSEQKCLSNNKHSEYWPSWSWIQGF